MDSPLANTYTDSEKTSLLPIQSRKSSTDKSRKTHRSSQDRQSTSWERVPRSSHDLARLRGYEEREASEVRYQAAEQLRVEKQRADDAEQRLQDVTARLKAMNDARLIALQESARANEELRLYKVQLETAQREIFRAQDVLHVVDVQKYRAEKEAVRARTAVRRLNDEKMVQLAREEGRRIGIQEGLKRGKVLGSYDGHHAAGRFHAEDPMEEQEEEYLEGEEEDDQTPPDSFHDPTFNCNSPNVEYLPFSPPQVQHPSDSVAEIAQGVPPVSELRPTMIHRITPSPRHPYTAISPEGYIPETGLDSIIRLPPPHELSRPPHTPRHSPSPPLPPLPEGEHFMIPVSPSTTGPQSVNVTAVRPHGMGRQSSPESNSTTISQFDMVKDPRFNRRRSPMSVILEVRSVHTSPNPLTNRGNRSLPRLSPRLSGRTSIPHPAMMTPTLQDANANVAGMEQHVARRYIHSNSRNSSSSSNSSSARTLSASRPSRETRRAGSPSVDSAIQPPSRTPSTVSREHSTLQPMCEFLNPTDAHCPTTLPDMQSNATSAIASAPGTSTTNVNTTILSDGQLKVVMPTEFTPATPPNPLLPITDNSIPTADGYHDVYSQTSETQHLNDVVISDLRLYGGNLDSDSDDAISSGMSASDDAYLTTPPVRGFGPQRGM